jgi:predicted glycoside hydrolase/deacetylase ChbG (UPF0249 family)
MIMKPNPVLKKLGFSNTDRLVILHTDDIGMCQASLQAFQDLWEFGTISSGAIMVPCPWAKAAGDFCKSQPKMDIGVHATLNAEWSTYRWPPLTTRDRDTGLLDEEGYMWRRSADVQERADPEAVLSELQAQVRRALDWGVEVTHVDTHMGTLAHPKLVPAYLQVAIENRLPPRLPRSGAALFGDMHMDDKAVQEMDAFTQQLEEQGLPLVDGLVSLPLDQPDGQIELAKNLLGGLPAGVTHFLFHPSIDTPELRAICPDWSSRVANYQTFMSPEIKDFIKNSGIHVIGYRDLKDTMTF